MEETPILSQKFTKSEATRQLNNHRSSSARGGASNNNKQHHPDPPADGQVAFRLLCHVHTAGGVIGSSGSIIKHLETVTGSKIRFEEGLPNCHERVINIVGEAALEKKISVGGGKEDEMVDVSKAQEGLIRVFERVLEVEGNAGNNENKDNNKHHSNGFIGCRLLVPTGQIGAVMGKGGKIVHGIRKSSGAKIRVLKEQIPACAGPEEELIQHHPVGHSLSADVERIVNLDEDSSLRKVVFRFMCSNGIAGGVIGKGANIVKSLEKETGASIKFASPVSGSKERVAIISALESPDPLYSPAQIAIVRVFARCIEVGLDQGVISSLDNGESVSARILVASSQVGCLLDEGGRVAADISTASGAEIQLMGADLLPSCAEVDDNVVQITSDYANVKGALFQVTGRLRENFFSEIPKGADCSAIPSSSPNVREAASSTQLAELPILSYIEPDHLGFVQKSSSSHLPGLQWDQANSRGSIPRPVDSARGLTTFPSGLKHESKLGNEEPKQIVEVVVPGELFVFVYGENGSNLARLKEISGTTVILQDPCPGESSGKVIICGTPERIQIAQSLLQAFISF
ncbi:hypothetical protein Pfo_007927 [Paulownia fortunei]|nr:hypothetical protein Pfo_007927 [Paulownia fortunei]